MEFTPEATRKPRPLDLIQDELAPLRAKLTTAVNQERPNQSEVAQLGASIDRLEEEERLARAEIAARIKRGNFEA